MRLYAMSSALWISGLHITNTFALMILVLFVFWTGENMRVTVHLYTQSQPVVYENVYNCYQKGDLYCVMIAGQMTVHKFPLQHIFRIIEEEVEAK